MFLCLLLLLLIGDVGTDERCTILQQKANALAQHEGKEVLFPHFQVWRRRIFKAAASSQEEERRGAVKRWKRSFFETPPLLFLPSFFFVGKMILGERGGGGGTRPLPHFSDYTCVRGSDVDRVPQLSVPGFRPFGRESPPVYVW